MSTYNFARYCYPAMWVAVLWVLLTADVKRRALVVSLLAVQLAMAAPLFMRLPDDRILARSDRAGESIESGGTLFSGIPIYGQTARQLLHDSKPCVGSTPRTANGTNSSSSSCGRCSGEQDSRLSRLRP